MPTHYRFNALKLVTLLTAATVLSSAGFAASPPTVLVSDNFNANTGNTTDLNVDIARQAGTLAPITYTMASGPGHYGHQLQNVNAVNQLLVADFPNSTSSLNQNFNGLNSAGGLMISFDVDGMPALYGSTPDNWGAINLGSAQADQMVNVNGGQAHFGILFRAAGTIQAFDGSAVVSPSPEPVYTTSPGGMHHIDLVITDVDGNPFDGLGDTIIEVFADNKPLPVWTYRKAGGYPNNFINLQGSFRAHFDNVVIARLAADRVPVIVNPSFEANNFTVFPGYVSGNGPITGWEALGGHGVNPGTFGGPFSDNGAIPDGTKVAFMQAEGPMRQVVSGFTIGATYQIRYYENARNGAAPSAAVTVGGQTVLAAHAVSPVGGSNPYRLATTDPFVATATAMELAFVKSNPLGGDTTLLIDNVTVVLPNTPPTITRQPQNPVAIIGDNVTFTVLASGSAPLAYQWFFNGSPISGANSASYTFLFEFEDQAGDYHVVISNSAGSATSSPATLTVRAVVPGIFNSGVDDSMQVLPDAAVDSHYRLIVNADSTSPDALVHSSTIFPISTGNWLANSSSSKWIAPRVDTGGAAGGDYVYRLTFSLDGWDPASAIISGGWATDNEGLDILINGVSTGSRNTAQFGSYTPFVISSGFLAGPNTLDFRLNNAGAGPTALRVDGLRGLATAVPPNTPPSIVAQPTNVSAIIGDRITLSVRATGSAPLTYQWYFGGDAMLDQTNATLNLFLEFEDLGGPYSVEVTNPFDSIRSREAIVTVNTLPVVTRQPQSQIAVAGESVTFTVQARGAEPFDYRWFRNGTEVFFSLDPTLTVTASTATAGEYVVEVSNPLGVTTSEPATLRIGQLLPFFNTGVDNASAALPDGSTDPHYRLVVNPDSASANALVEDSTVFPIVTGPWVANNDHSKWIGPRVETSAAAGGAGAAGNYTYRATLDLTGFDPAAMQITGVWATDNAGLDIFVNGESTTQANPLEFANFSPFVLSNSFRHGVNTIDFTLNNAALGYTGLRVDQVRAVGVPLPSGVAPFVVSNPQNATAGLGDTVVFTASISGSLPLQLQWYYRPGTSGAFTPVPGATASTLSLAITSGSQAGQYLLRGINAAGSVDTTAATLTVNVPNQPPFFTKGPNVTVLEDSGPQSIAAWATAISPGAASESGQVLTFNVSGSNPLLFSVQPAIAANGTLSFTAAPDTFGSAVITVVLADNGGTANGGVDRSAPQTFTINVTPVNDCPTVASASASTAPGTAVGINLAVSDIDTAVGSLSYIISTPSKGVVSGTPPNLVYTPNASACGSDSFTVIMDDGQCRSAAATVSITILCNNQPPVAVAEVQPLADFSPTLTDLIVISPNGSNAPVVLDASQSSDPDGDALTYQWFVDGQLVGSGVQASAVLALGSHEIRLVVSDGRGGSDTDVLQVEVISGGTAVEILVALVDDADIARGNKRPFLATLKSVSAALEDGRTGPALNMLNAFQNKVRAQVGKANPDVAAEWIAIAQTIIDALDQ